MTQFNETNGINPKSLGIINTENTGEGGEFVDFGGKSRVSQEGTRYVGKVGQVTMESKTKFEEEGIA